MSSPIAPSVSGRQLDRFAANGFLVLPKMVSTAVIEALRFEADAVLRQLLDQMVETRVRDPRVTWWRLPSGDPYVLKVKPVVDLSPTAMEVADSKPLRAMAADLLSAPPRLMENKFMYKQVVAVDAGWAGLPVLGEEVCKHTDAAYFFARGYQRVLTVAVCLDPCTEAAGALRVWPGSHLRSVEMVTTDNQGPVVPDSAAPDAEALSLIAAAGWTLAWDSTLVHASGPNVSRCPRRLLVLGYAPAGGGNRQ